METEPQETQELTVTMAPPAQQPIESVEYVVQMRMGNVEGMDNSVTWWDITTVTVPPRTRRKTILEKALDDVPEHKPTADRPREYRVLDAQSFEAIPASIVPPEPSDPVLRIG